MEGINEIEESQWDIDYSSIQDIIKKAKEQNRNTLFEDEAREILEIAEIPIARGQVVQSIEEAVDVAEKIGYPLVLKVVSEDIIHKMDVGGVRLGVHDQAELVDAYESICSQVRNRIPNAKIKGISVSEYVEEGEEVVIGGMIDPSFGPVVMFGLGGIYVELLKDVVFRIAPIDTQEACEMIQDTQSFSILIGARGKERKDIKSIAEMISKLGDLIYFVDGINDIDLNPVAAMKDRAVALDVAINVK
ncbi:MAG: acetate--CoA ligase family protein [Candidatus Saliniplasma sp.]